MKLVRIGQTVVNMDAVATLQINTSQAGPRWAVDIAFIGPAPGVSGHAIRFEGGDAARLMDWLRRNALDVEDWRSEKGSITHE